MKSSSLNTAQLIATCPGCGLLCDDIVLEITNNQLKVINSNCAKTVAFFEQNLAENSPQIAGKPVTLQAAISKVAEILRQAHKPIFTGLGTDVQGFRALYQISQKINANLSHMNATSMARNLKVLQSTGWQTTTLTEVKNRADVIVCFGSNLLSHNARFFERFVDTDGMFVSAKNRQVVVLGEARNLGDIKSDALQAAWTLPCLTTDLPSITMALRALVAGKQLKATEVAGVKVNDLQTLADKLKAAKYAVLAWVAKDLDFNHAELTIQNITEIVTTLNKTTRAAGLPLGGSDGDTSANNAHTWLSGLALNDDDFEHAEHDAMVWVNSFSPEKEPPKNDKPLIIVGNPNIKHQADVFIPITTPGLDCSGTLFRVDSSVVLPLKKVRENNLPTLAQVISQIEAQLK
jgi:formylmethanofuran dehydrogenase subunit B